MYVSAAQLREQLQQLQPRHAETDARILRLIAQTQDLIAEVDAMLAEPRPQ